MIALALLLVSVSQSQEWTSLRDKLAREMPALAGAGFSIEENGEVVIRLSAPGSLTDSDLDSVLAALLATSPDRARRSIRALRVIDRQGRAVLPLEVSPSALAELATSWKKQRSSPSPFFSSSDVATSGSLAGIRIVISAGHGIDWYSNEDQWRYQRPLLFDLREDIHTQQIVSQYLAPMLEAAGAEVVLLRERSTSAQRLVVDNEGDGYFETGAWNDGASSGHGGGYRTALVEPGGDLRATWSFGVDEARIRPVYAWYLAGENRSTAARFEIDHAAGTSIVLVDQTRDSERWRYLGSFSFVPGSASAVHLLNAGSAAERVVVADAIRVGGGAGFVDFGGGISGEPRWRQSARANAIEDEVPSSVRSGLGDVTVRPAIALWQGAEYYFAIHTNAGGGRGTSSFVYSRQVAYPSFDPDRAEALPEGTLEFQEAIHERVLDTLRAHWRSDWPDRGLWGADFGELRPIAKAWKADPSVVVPAALIEIAFHDDEADAAYLRTDRFRHDVSRAILRGFIAHAHRGDLENAVTPPLAPEWVSAVVDETGVMFDWRESVDPLDDTAVPEGYSIELALNGGPFGPAIDVAATEYHGDGFQNCDTVAARVTAWNAGGASMPSGVIVARVVAESPRVLWVDGTRRLVRSAVESPDDPAVAQSMLGDLAAACEGALLVESARAEAVGAGEVSLSGYNAVVWTTGETSTWDDSLTQSEQTAIDSFLNGGGALVLSGAEIGWDLSALGSSEEQAFFEEVLHAQYVGDDANTFKIIPGESALWLAGAPAFLFEDGSGGSFRVEYPDVLAPGDGASAELTYESGGIAAIRYDGVGKLFLAGFPLETIQGDARQLVLDGVLRGMLGEIAAGASCGTPYGSVVETESDPGSDSGGDGDDADGVDPLGGDATLDATPPKHGCACDEFGGDLGVLALAIILSCSTARRLGRRSQSRWR